VALASAFMPTIFLSYGRGDDESFARRLHDDLTERGFDVWFDRVSMPSRRLTFHQEIRDAIGTCDRLLLVVGPHAVASDYVRQEWQFAWFDSEKMVTPVLRIGEYALVPDELKVLQCEDFRDDSRYEAHFRQLERVLRDQPPKLGELIGVPSLPAHYLPRTDRLVALRHAVRAGLDSPIYLGGALTYPRIHGITGSTKHLGIHGMGGIGKSFLANLLVHDRKVREAFPDGIIWVGLGTSPEIRRRMVDIHRAFGGDSAIANEAEGKQKLINLLRNKAALLVLDDAWHRSDLDWFDVLGPRCRALVTTRDEGLIGAMNAVSYPVELLSDEEGLQLLAVSAGLEISALTAEALEVLAQCGQLPLAVALAGSMVRAGVPWIDLRDSLRDHELEFLEDPQSANPLHVNLWRMIEISVAALADDVQHRLAELAVFPTDEQVPDAAIATLWSQTGGLSPRQSRKLLVDLRKRSLLQLTHTADILADSVGKCSIHDLIHSFCMRLARRQVGNETLLHDFLLSAYQDTAGSWWNVPNDGYFFDHLRTHLIAAGRTAELVGLMQCLPWLETKANAGLAFDIAADFTAAVEVMAADSSDRKRAELLRAALRTDIQFIARHPTAVFQCFWNRCWWYDSPQAGRHYEAPAGGWPPPGPPWEEEGSGLYRLMERWKKEKEARSPGFYWLRSLRPPDIHLGSRQRAVIHTATEVTDKQVADKIGRRILFSSDSLRVGYGNDWWSVETGIKMLTQPELANETKHHDDRPRQVSPDGRIVVELGENCAFRILDAKGEILATTSPLELLRPPIPPHLSYMDEKSLLKNTPDTQAILASARITFSPDGSMFAVHGEANWSPFEWGHGYWGNWETRTGNIILPLRQFKYRVHDVVFSPDSRYLALAAGDPGDGILDHEQGSFALWNLTSGTLVVQLGFNDDAYTTGVMFSFASDRVFAWGGVRDGDFDYGYARGYLGVWETANGRQLSLQTGGDRCLSCLSLSPDGSRFAVGLYDGRVGLGDLTSLEMQLLTGHLGAVISVAFDPAGILLASLGEDGTIRLLASEASGCDPGQLQNQEEPLVSVQFTNDGARAVTRCSRHTVWLWDTQSGEVVAKPRSHGVIVYVGHPPAFYFDGKSLVVDGETLVDTTDGKVILSPDESSLHRHKIIAVAHHGKALARLRDDGDAAEGEIAFLQGGGLTVPLDLPKMGHRAAAISFSPDDRWLAMEYESRGVMVYDVLTGRRRFSLPDPGPFLFSADCRHLLAAGAEPLRLYDVESGAEVARQPLSTYWASEAVSPDGRLRATVSGGRVEIVDVGSGHQSSLLERHKPLETEFAFTRNPRFLLTRDGGREILLWDLEKGKEVPSENWLEKVPNVRRDGTVIVRHPHTGEEILSIRDGSVSNAAFDRDCQHVFFVTGDGVTRIWDIGRGTCSELSERPLLVHAVAADDPYYAVAAIQETAIIDATTKEEVAWFPVAFDTNGKSFASYPPFRLWGAGSSHRFYLFSLEGAAG
jgi:WD40 repeat protein